jgi:phosphoglycolate phosphatase
MKYKLAIFDFDGTLANSFPFFMNTINTLAEQFKFKKIDASETESLRALGARKIMKHVGLPLWKVPFVGMRFKEMMAHSIDQIDLFTGAIDMLQALSAQGVVVSLVTSNSYDNVCQKLNSGNMELLTHPQCDTSVFGKRTALRTILRKTGVSHNDAIYIGDEIRDWEAANAEAINFGAVSWGYTTMDALMKYSPAETFFDMDDIVNRMGK